jgi:D-mannonate dehydratase
VCCDNRNQCPNRNGHNLLQVHLSFATTEQSEMQTNPLHMEQDARIDAVYRVIKGNLNWDNLVPTLLEGAKELENFPSLKGSEKLDILQKALKHALKESDKSNEEKEKILYYIDTVVPVAVQAAVSASKNPLVNAAVAQVEAVCIGCWTKK